MPLQLTVKDSVECQIYVVYEGVLNKPEMKAIVDHSTYLG
jgi:hypothetical protein